MATNANNQIYRRYARNLALMYQKRKDVRSFVEILLSLSVIIIFGIFAIKPTLVTISDLTVQIKGREDTIEKLDDKIAALITAQENFDRNRGAISLVSQAIPAAPEPDLYIRQVEGLVNRHSLFIVGLNTEDVAILGAEVQNLGLGVPVVGEESSDFFPSDAYSFTFEINVSGDFQNINSFLRDLESLRRPMYTDVLSVRISQGSLPGDLVASIVGRLAYTGEGQGGL